MDELEISGKRYISTRRAAKEHKYHSDYIGQLIRGGKVAGQKVGRSWYVAADSLAEYLNNEVSAKAALRPPVAKPAPIIKGIVREPVKEIKEAPLVVQQVQEVPEEIAQPIVVEEIAEEEIEEKENDEREIPISIQRPLQIIRETPVVRTRSSLRYIPDDGPLYPRVERAPQIKMRMSEPVEEIAETMYVDEEPVTIIERPTKKNNLVTMAARGGVVLVAGLIAVGIAAGLSALIVSTTTINEQTATVNYAVSLPN
jgi:hypothetical protein